MSKPTSKFSSAHPPRQQSCSAVVEVISPPVRREGDVIIPAEMLECFQQDLVFPAEQMAAVRRDLIQMIADRAVQLSKERSG